MYLRHDLPVGTVTTMTAVTRSPRKRRISKSAPPTRKIEQRLALEGISNIVGLDEVGRGSWAGPLTIAAVRIPTTSRVHGIRDSKKLSQARREQLYPRIMDWCTDIGIGHVSAEECDTIGMSAAMTLAAHRALAQLVTPPEIVLIDGNWDFVGKSHRTETVKHGDATCLSIATASVVAKVTRDRIMTGYSEDFPAFQFDQNKGYPCPRHRMALWGYGPTRIHRRSWAFMDDLVWSGRRALQTSGNSKE